MRIMQTKIILFYIYGLILFRFGYRVQCLKSDKFYAKQQRTIEQLGVVSVRARSLIECTLLCLTDIDCFSGVYSKEENQCQMTSQRYPSMVYSNDSLVFASCLDIIRFTTDPPNNRVYLPQLIPTIVLKSQLVLKIKSCSRASIAFLDDTTFIFFVDFGTNTLFESRINYFNSNRKYASFETPIINCQNFTSFWVSWNISTVDVGMGDVVGDNMYLTCDYHVTLPPIDNVGVLTESTPGDWQFEAYQEDC